MRTVSSNIRALVNNYDELKFFVLARIQLSSSSLGYSSLPYNVIINGVTYTSGTLMDYDAPVTGTSLDKVDYQIVVSDPSQTLENMLIEDKAFSAPFYVHMGLYDPDSKLPLLDPADLITVYEGLVDTWVSQTSESEKQFLIKGTSPMGALDWSNPFYTSPNTVKRYISGDTTFDLNGSLLEDEITLKWGKK